jgi:hypothetical protein
MKSLFEIFHAKRLVREIVRGGDERQGEQEDDQGQQFHHSH